MPVIWEGETEIRDRGTAWSGVTEAMGQSRAPVPFHPGLWVRDGGPGLGLGRTHLCAPLTRLLGTVPEPEGPYSQLQVGVQGKEGGTLQLAWLQTLGALWVQPLCPLCCGGWDGPGVGLCVLSQSLRAVTVTLGSGMRDVLSWPGILTESCPAQPACP